MATKKKNAKKQTPKVPYCGCCGSTNVTTVAWVEWRDDGTERPTNCESPISGDEGNWCSDCDENSEDGGYVEIIYPESMNTPAASNRRLANNAAREHGPQLLKLLSAVLDAVGDGMIDGGEEGERAIEKAYELIGKLTV
jgi:hypothetical protein